MRRIWFMIIFIALSLTVGITLAVNSNISSTMVDDEIENFLNHNTSRFYIDRSSFETNLVQLIPAPQEYTNELPPRGVREVIYDSGNLKLKAWLAK
jgi:hypothetical protein